MTTNSRNTYKEAGVDVEAGYEVVQKIQESVKSTQGNNSMGAIGGFGGCFDLGKIIQENNISDPVLVSGTDGIGTKLKLAIELGIHNTVGIDLVAMCVNDIITIGAKPLYFLDYLAQASIEPNKVADIVEGIAEGCKQSGMELIGGETAEMPGMYAKNDYDAAGFAVGVVSKAKMLSTKNVKSGDQIIGIPSSGVHSNGFSLVRKILKDSGNDQNTDLLKELLTPTKIYVKDLLNVQNDINSAAHITGGGFNENVPRAFDKNLKAIFDTKKWEPNPIFKKLQDLGSINTDEMFSVFNMGIGMMLFVDPKNQNSVLDKIDNACVIGEILSKDNDEPQVTIN